jgi:hypothetical protein
MFLHELYPKYFPAQDSVCFLKPPGWECTILRVLLTLHWWERTRNIEIEEHCCQQYFLPVAKKSG